MLNSALESVLPANEPVPNFGVERYRLRDYADCTTSAGCYWEDLAAQVRRASALMESSAKAQPKGAKMAIVLDIDETSLTNYCEEVREDFDYIPDRYDAWLTSHAAAMPIKWTVILTRRAQQLGVDVFFITGRPEAQRTATEANLKAAGYSDWKGLALKQPDVAYASTSSYKSKERQKIVDLGYTLLLNMGDQWSDLQWPPMAEHSVKLPNPFYYLP
jgi:predicted secreted acid phosphatase